MIKVNNEVVELNSFPDSTSNVKGNPCLVNGNVLISWHYENDAEFMPLAFLTRYYQAHGNKVALYLPYVPNARMDRVEEAEDVLAIKYFGELINSLNFTNVFVLDVHSSATMVAIKNCVIVDEEDMFIEVITDIFDETDNFPIVFFPDEGAMKRYSKGMKIPFAYGMKKRDWNTGNILGLEICGIDAEKINGSNIIIRDDICSYGGTFYHAAKKLKEMGANDIYLMVTHCEHNIHNGRFGEGKENLLDTGLIKKVFTTNSTYPFESSEMVKVYKTKLTFDNIEAEYDCESCGTCFDCDGCKCDCDCKED